MKMVVLLYFFLSIVILICKGLRVLGPSGPLTVQPGGSVMLPCYVDTPIPVEELEVEWRRTDSDAVVHVFKDGESQPESQDQEYHDRARLFTEEVAHGNFSLLLTDMTVKDTGVYKCVVYRNQESNEMMVEIKLTDHFTVSGVHVVSVHMGEDVTLTCSVHSHIAPEQIEQVSWKKMDEDIVVLLFAQGEIQLDLTHERYRDRVELFSPEEIHKGNFSLRLKNIQTEDKGLYICEALHETLSANTTVEVLQLGLSGFHIAVLIFCACVCLSGISLLVVCIPLWCFKENSNWMIKIQYALVFCPNVAMFLAFILWSQAEGFFGEVAVCSAVNLVRILRLLYYCPFTSSGMKLSTALECPVIFTVIYSVMWHVWGKEFKILLAVVGVAVVVLFMGFFSAVFFEHKLPEALLYSIVFLYRISRGFLFGLNLFAIVFTAIFYVYWRGLEKDKLGLIIECALLFNVSILAFVEWWFSDSEKHPGFLVFKLCICGAAVLFLMNSIALSTELILCARNGKRTIPDLQVVLLPFECVFAIGYIIAIFVVELSEQKDKEEDTKERNEEAVELKHVEQSTSPPLGHEEGGHGTDE